MFKEASVPFTHSGGVQVLKKPTDVLRNILLNVKHFKDNAKEIETVKDPYQRAKKLKDLYTIYISEAKKNEGYDVDGMVSRINDDEIRLEKIIDLIDTTVKNAKDYAPIIVDLQNTIIKEKDNVTLLKKALDGIKEKASLYSVELKKIEKDLEDKDVTTLYEVAKSEELFPDEAKKEKILRKQERKEKDIKRIGDRDTFKKNMMSLMKRHPDKKVREVGSEISLADIEEGINKDFERYEYRAKKILPEKDPTKRAESLVKLYGAFLRHHAKKKDYGLVDKSQQIADDENVVRALLSYMETAKDLDPNYIKEYENAIKAVTKQIELGKHRVSELRSYFADRDDFITRVEEEYAVIKDDLKDGTASKLYSVPRYPEIKPMYWRKTDDKEPIKIMRTPFDEGTFRLAILRLLKTFEIFRSIPRDTSPSISKSLEEIKKEEERAKEDLRRSNEAATEWGKKFIQKAYLENTIARHKNNAAQYEKIIGILDTIQKDILPVYLSYKDKKGTDPKEIDKIEQEKNIKFEKLLFDALRILGAPAGEGEPVEKLIESESKKAEYFKQEIEEYKEAIPDLENMLRSLTSDLTKKPPAPDIRKVISDLTQEYKAIDSRPHYTQEEKKTIKDKISEDVKELYKQLGEEGEIITPGAPAPSQKAYIWEKGEKYPYGEKAFKHSEPKPLKEPKPSKAPKTPKLAGKTEIDWTDFNNILEYSSPAAEIERAKKFKEWGLVEELFDNTKRTLDVIQERKEKELPTKVLEDKSNELKRVLPMIRKYMDQVIEIFYENKDEKKNMSSEVPLKDLYEEFDSIIQDYTDERTRLINNRNKTSENISEDNRKIEDLQTYMKPGWENKELPGGEYKDLPEKEKDNMRKVFWRELYEGLDIAWSQHIGQNVAAIGERNSQWYNNVYRTFRNLAGVKSNNVIIGLIKSLENETKAGPDAIARYKTKVLTVKLSELMAGMREYGIDASKSRMIKDIIKQINDLREKELDIDRLYDIMAGRIVSERIKGAIETKTEVKDLPSRAERTAEKMEEALKPVIEEVKKLKSIEEKIDEVKDKPVEGTPVTKDVYQQIEDELSNFFKEYDERERGKGSEVKTAFTRKHADFDLRHLYSDIMQKTIVDMVNKELNKLAAAAK